MKNYLTTPEPALALMSAAIRIDGLVEINPEHPGEQGKKGSEWQEEEYGGNHDFLERPVRPPPQHQPKNSDSSQAKSIADIHRAQEVAFFAFELQVADRTAFVHSRKQEKRPAEDLTAAAAGTELKEDAACGGNIPFGHV